MPALIRDIDAHSTTIMPIALTTDQLCTFQSIEDPSQRSTVMADMTAYLCYGHGLIDVEREQDQHLCKRDRLGL
jgi:hypothetical protein